MNRWAKVGIVVAGYAAAVVAAVVVGFLYNVQAGEQPYDTSGGMYAFGELTSSLAVFLAVALVPTILALWFMRPFERLWNALAIAALMFAAAGLAAVLLPLVTHAPGGNIALQFASLFALTQLLGVPLWFVGFALFALLAPSRRARRKLIAAAAIELVIGLCAVLHWFVRGSPL